MLIHSEPQVMATNKAESAHPELWDGLDGLIRFGVGSIVEGKFVGDPVSKEK